MSWLISIFMLLIAQCVILVDELVSYLEFMLNSIVDLSDPVHELVLQDLVVLEPCHEVWRRVGNIAQERGAFSG